jgi:threonyl-tRNA synthetase
MASRVGHAGRAHAQSPLADGNQRTYPHPLSIQAIAESIGPGLARAAIAGKVDGRLVDTSS